MDKFAVDLDKVLNDFEYTELTDHNVESAKPLKPDNNKQELKNVNVTGGSAYNQSLSNTSVKHSITNVFHSLNEYINTDISDKCNVNFVNPSRTFKENADESVNGNKQYSEDTFPPLPGAKKSVEDESKEKPSDIVVSVTGEGHLDIELEPTLPTDLKEGTDEGEAVISKDEDVSIPISDFSKCDEKSNEGLETKEDITNEVNVIEKIPNNNCDSVVDVKVSENVSNNNKIHEKPPDLDASSHLKTNEDNTTADVIICETTDIAETTGSIAANSVVFSDVENIDISNEEIIVELGSKGSEENTETIDSESSEYTECFDENINEYNRIEDVLVEETRCDVKKTDHISNVEDTNINDNIRKTDQHASADMAKIETSNIDKVNEIQKDDIQNTEKNDSLSMVVENATVTECTENQGKNIVIANPEAKVPSSDISRLVDEVVDKPEELQKVGISSLHAEVVREPEEEQRIEVPGLRVETSKELESTQKVDISSLAIEAGKELGSTEQADTASLALKDEKEDEETQKVETSAFEDVQESEEPQKVCFDDNLVNMNDADLNKYLEELEEEFESQYKSFEEDEVDLNNATIETNLTISEEDDSETKQDASLEESVNAGVTNLKINVIEPPVSEINSENQANEEILEVTVEKLSSTELRPHSGEQNDQSRSHSRPSSLDLGSSPSEGKKSIDLIGEPGSTPYNNVYIAEELPQSDTSIRPCEQDSENSSCTSPTFSNASTETVSTSSESSDIPFAENNTTVIGITEQAPKNGENDGDVAAVSATAQAVEEGGAKGDAGQSEAGSENTGADQEGAGGGGGDMAIGERGDNVGSSGGGGSGEREPRQLAVEWLGRQAPIWLPDSDALNCMHCDMKFTVIRRRHHCRACGLVLCSKCTNYKYKLEYLDAEARVCNKCYDILNRDTSSSSLSDFSVDTPSTNQRRSHPPNPNNPLEYCSTVPPLQQIQSAATPPAVLVPVGVLKRKGSTKMKTNKNVMFCDGIRPGSDLANLDNDFNYKDSLKNKKSEKPVCLFVKQNKNCALLDPETKSFIPSSDNNLPPTITLNKTDITYSDCANNPNVVEMLKNETLIFAIQKNLFVHVKIVKMDCCINKTAWCFCTEGLINVGQDEVVIILEYIDDEVAVPKDIFFHLNVIYNDALKGSSVKELGLSLHNTSNFLDSKNHAGFVFIKPTFQCLQNIIKPNETYLIGILIHRWETPWAKLFPLRLILRLGAEYRYYPSPIISTRHRDSVFVEIGHTIINLLADFRNYSYTLPQIRGLTIHMEDKNTTVTIPVNRYDQVMKSMSNSSDHILAFAGNFSMQADSHLVCIQDTQSNDNSYSTHAINIHNKPRKVTGASFIVFNGALKSSSGLTAKSSIVEDGLMIQIPPEHMTQVRESLRNMKNHVIQCGCINAATDETVNVIWGEADVSFNVGVASPIDGQSMSGIPSIRVHNGKDYISSSGTRLIRWTEVFILLNAEEYSRNPNTVDISKVSESIAKATCQALVKYLDLLVSNNFYKIGIRPTLHVEKVSYVAGGNSVKLPPIYMRSLDNELIPVLHRMTSTNMGDSIVILELIFRILNV